MKIHRTWQILVLAFELSTMSIGSDAAPNLGTMVVNGKTTTFSNAYAFHHPASHDKSVIQTAIVLSDKAIDSNKIKAEGGDFESALRAWLDDHKVAYWEVILDPDGTVFTGAAVSPGVMENYGTVGCKVEMTRNDAKRAEGSCRTDDEKEKEKREDGLYVDVKFAVDF